jgi:hypothetical protein
VTVELSAPEGFTGFDAGADRQQQGRRLSGTAVPVSPS